MMRIILIGGSETVYFLARQLRNRDHKVTIINRDEQRCQELFAQTSATVILGDGSSQSVLEEAGARQADIVLALTPNDFDNLVACQIAQKIFGVPRSVALVNDPDNEEVFRKLGVSHAFSSTRIIGSMIEQQAGFDEITRLMPIGEGRIHITDLKLERHSPAVGKTLGELSLSQETLIACIIRNDEVIIPRGSNQLQVGDHLLVISKPGYEERDLRIITGDREA